MPLPLMPKATAVWLVENTALTFEQIADFCGLHSWKSRPSPTAKWRAACRGWIRIINGQLTHDEIKRLRSRRQSQTEAAGQQSAAALAVRTKGGRYTPIAKRQDKPDAIAWLVRNYPDITDSQISKLLGTIEDDHRVDP